MPSKPLTCGTSSPLTGWCSTASCCPGRRRRWSLSVASTRRSARRRTPACRQRWLPSTWPLPAVSTSTELLERQRQRIEHVDRYVDAYRRYVWPVNGLSRPSPRPVPSPRRRDRRLHRPRPRLAPRALRPTRCGRSRLVSADRPSSCRCHRRRGPGSRHGVVGGADGERWRGHGRQADELHRARAQRPRPAWHQVPRPRVPTHHLRPRVRRPQPDRSAANPQPRTQAFARHPRVRTRHRGAGAIRRREPLYRVHECVFGVLAMETEPVDPRL